MSESPRLITTLAMPAIAEVTVPFRGLNFLRPEVILDFVTISNNQLLSNTKAFCSAISAAGFTPGVYANTNWWTHYLASSEYDKWPRWVAQYNWQCTYGKHYDVWQADEQSSVSGITEAVDVNFDFTGPLVHGDQWVYSNGSWWYHYKDGSYPKNGWAQIDGKWYYFDSSGWMQTG